MMWLMAIPAVDFDVLDREIAQCDRAIVSPVFASEAERRGAFLGDAYREQQAIVAERADIAGRRRAIREGHGAALDNDQALSLRALSIEDRQRALNDSRALERLRIEAIDAKRHLYLVRCTSKAG